MYIYTYIYTHIYLEILAVHAFECRVEGVRFRDLPFRGFRRFRGFKGFRFQGCRAFGIRFMV